MSNTDLPLSKTNKYLKDPIKTEEAIINNVITSSAVEGLIISKAQLKRLIAIEAYGHLKVANVKLGRLQGLSVASTGDACDCGEPVKMTEADVCLSCNRFIEV